MKFFTTAAMLLPAVAFALPQAPAPGYDTQDLAVRTPNALAEAEFDTPDLAVRTPDALAEELDTPELAVRTPDALAEDEFDTTELAVRSPNALAEVQFDKGEFILDLIRNNKITVADVEEKSVTKRGKVPGLHCGWKRALACVAHSASTINSCIWAVIHTGEDIQDDTSCIAAATALGSLLPNDCKLCLFGHL